MSALNIPATTFQLANGVRNVQEPFSTIVASMPGFLSSFGRAATRANNVRVEWGDGFLSGQSFSQTSATAGGLITASAAEIEKLKAGTIITAANGTAFRIVADPVPSATTAQAEFVAATRSADTSIANIPVGAVKYRIASRTNIQGSKPGAPFLFQSQLNYNFTQILRRDITIARTALQTLTYGNEITLPNQVEMALQDMAIEMAQAAVLGVRYMPSSNVLGSATGGLNFFAAQPGGITIAAAGAQIDEKLVGKGVEQMRIVGGRPDILVCSPSQARVLGLAMGPQIQVQRDDERVGRFVSGIMTPFSAVPVRVVIDDALSQSPDVAYLVDSTKCGVAFMSPVAVSMLDELGTDGDAAKIVTEFAFVFQNFKQSIATISGLKSPDTI